MKHLFMTTDADIEAGYPEVRASFDNNDPDWPTKARGFISASKVPAYRISWFVEYDDTQQDDDQPYLELVGTAEDLN